MEIEERVVNSLRLTAVNMIEKAKSGHPGMALDIMPTLYTLYAKHLRVNPKQPNHQLRDRLVVSAGHCSSALYSVLNAFGFDISVGDLKNFRQCGSIATGHPEIGIPGVDCSTGPLGQGVAVAVGLALAERMLAEKINVGDIQLIDNYTYAIVGEGCLMEGVSYEALSLAGSLKLNKLIVLYDCNKKTIDGDILRVFDINLVDYAKSIGFNVLKVSDGNSLIQIDEAIKEAKNSEKPVFIILNTKIGFGSLNEGSEITHGGPLGDKDIAHLRKTLNIQTEPFKYDANVRDWLKNFKQIYKDVDNDFKERLAYYKKNFPDKYDDYIQFLEGKADYAKLLENFATNDLECPTKEFSKEILAELASHSNKLVGGSADLTNTTGVRIGKHFVQDSFKNYNIKYGVREFAMGCISNGLALYGFEPFCSTFMSFSDYMMPAIRMSSMMQLPVKYIFTHDGISAGEDGPTHQVSSQLMTLRAMPNLLTFRPCNFEETKACYSIMETEKLPSIIALSKMKTNKLKADFKGALRGGYVLRRESKMCTHIILIATGSEVSLAVDVARELEFDDLGVRVVSIPSFEIFDRQSEEYKRQVLPPEIPKLSIEAGITFGWQKYVNIGESVGFDNYLTSGKVADLYNKNKFNVANIVKIAKKLIKNNKNR